MDSDIQFAIAIILLSAGCVIYAYSYFWAKRYRELSAAIKRFLDWRSQHPGVSLEHEEAQKLILGIIAVRIPILEIAHGKKRKELLLGLRADVKLLSSKNKSSFIEKMRTGFPHIICELEQQD